MAPTQTQQLELQAYWNGGWHDAGTVSFYAPEKGLFGPLRFSYHAHYVLQAMEHFGFEESIDFRDVRAVGVNLRGNFSADYTDGVVGAMLRDIIPQGAGRGYWIRAMGLQKDPGAIIDFELLRQGCVSPVGNLRIREAAEAFAARLDEAGTQRFTREQIIARSDDMIQYAQDLGVAIGGATGAGGDAPKLLLVEDNQERFALEATIPDTEVKAHWLVKFPRGRKTNADIAVLESEACIYQALAHLGFDTITGARMEWHDGIPALWLPRFDRNVTPEGVERYAMESIYSLMGMIGDGAALKHPEVLKRLLAVAPGDEVLVSYLLHDVINTTIGNRDNHGRNMALIKKGQDIGLSPSFDLAPMALDPEGIARATKWPEEYRKDTRDPDYPTILKNFAGCPETAMKRFAERLEALAHFPEALRAAGAPDAMVNHPGVRLGYINEVLEALPGPAAEPAGSRQ